MPTDGFQDAEDDEGYWASLGDAGDRALFDNTVQNQYVSQLGRAADQAELDDWHNQGGAPGHWRNLRTDLQGRNTNTPGGTQGPPGPPGPTETGDPGDEDPGATDPGAYPGYPTPAYSQFSTPERPTTYNSTYSPDFAQQFTGVGETNRDRLLKSILENPETMDQDYQDKLFENSKEDLLALKAQNKAQLNQNLLQGGMSQLGGRARLETQTNNSDFNSQLLKSRRDISVMATQQNRADTKAALEMQDAIANGDFSRMMSVYQANNQVKAQTEDFLRNAASLNQSGVLGWNSQNLNVEEARHGGMMDYYNFLENQRMADNNYFQRQWQIGMQYV